MRADDEEKLQAAKNEYNIQKDLKHSTLIEVKELFLDSMRNTSYTVMELIEGKQLEELIYKQGPYKGISIFIANLK